MHSRHCLRLVAGRHVWFRQSLVLIIRFHLSVHKIAGCTRCSVAIGCSLCARPPRGVSTLTGSTASKEADRLSGSQQDDNRKRIGTRIAADPLVVAPTISSSSGTYNEVSVEVSDENHAQSALAFTYQVGRMLHRLVPLFNL